MTFPPFTGTDALHMAGLSESSAVVDHLSVHRDVALAIIIKPDVAEGEDDYLLLEARCDGGLWRRVEEVGDRPTVDVQLGGGVPSPRNRELVYRVADATLRTRISPRGNWAFVYSDPLGREVRGTSVVEGDFLP